MKAARYLLLMCVGITLPLSQTLHPNGYHMHIRLKVGDKVEEWDYHRSTGDKADHQLIRRSPEHAEVKSWEECFPAECVPGASVRISDGLSESARVVPLGTTATLPCHVCGRVPGVRTPRVWLKFQRRLLVESDQIIWRPQEVALDMHDDDRLNRVYTTPEHALIIEDFQPDDAGTYFCVEFTEQIDSMSEWTFTSPQQHESPGAVTLGLAWKQQSRDRSLDHMMHMDVETWQSSILVSEDGYGYAAATPPTTASSNNWQAFTLWESWGPCTVCGPAGERRRQGHCVVMLLDSSRPASPEYMDYVLHLYPSGAPCHSSLFQGYDVIQQRPNEIEVGICQESCTGGFSSEEYGIDLTMNNLFEDVEKEEEEENVIHLHHGPERHDVNLTVGTELLLLCPGVNDSSTVAWINNTGDNVVGSTDGNTVSNTGDNAVGNATGNISSTSVHTGRNHTRSPGVLVGLDLMEQTGGRVSLPLNHSLYFSRLELWDSGNYSCWSHGMVHLVAQITVVPKPENMTLRYFYYLCYTFAVDFVVFVFFMCSQHMQRHHQAKRRRQDL